MERIWFTVTEVWFQQQVWSAAASKVFHLLKHSQLVWMTRSTRMAGLHITNTVTKKPLSPSRYLIWSSAYVVQEQCGAVPSSRALQTPKCHVWREPVIQMLAARTCMKCFVMCPGSKVQSQFLKSLFWCLVASVCSANTRAKEWREEKKQEEGTWVQLYSRRGYLQALRLMKAYCYKNIPPTSWHETIFILSFIEFKSFFSQLLNLKLCLYTAQSEWRYVKASDLYLFFFPEELQGCHYPAGSDMTKLSQNCNTEQQTESYLRVQLTDITPYAGLVGLT